MNEQQKKQGVKLTGGVEGGTKSHLMVVMPPNAPAPAVTPGGVPGPGADAAGVAGTFRPRLANESNDVPLALSQVHEHLAALTGGRPKSAAGVLCYPPQGREDGPRPAGVPQGRRRPVRLGRPLRSGRLVQEARLLQQGGVPAAPGG